MKKTLLLIAFVSIIIQFGNAQNNIAGNALKFNGESCLNFGSVDFNLTDKL